MPPRGIAEGSKRARQYEHIKDSLEERGRSEKVAEKIAAGFAPAPTVRRAARATNSTRKRRSWASPGART